MRSTGTRARPTKTPERAWPDVVQWRWGVSLRPDGLPARFTEPGWTYQEQVPVPLENTMRAVSCAEAVGSSGAPVLVDQASEDGLSPNPASLEVGDGGRAGRSATVRGPLLAELMWAVPVVVTHVLAQRRHGMGFVVDQHAIQDLAAEGCPRLSRRSRSLSVPAVG
jgi:hypothetical protein